MVQRAYNSTYSYSPMSHQCRNVNVFSVVLCSHQTRTASLPLKGTSRHEIVADFDLPSRGVECESAPRPTRVRDSDSQFLEPHNGPTRYTVSCSRSCALGRKTHVMFSFFSFLFVT